MIFQGLTLTIIGMLVVFLILILLVAVMKLMSAVVFRYFPEPEKPVQSAQQTTGTQEVAVAIATAYAQKNR
ncbi:MAG: OadG family transporter subunit [Spirochaetia bacterium]